MVVAAEDAELVHLAGQVREQLADADAGDVGLDGAVRPADFDWGVRLRIEGFELAGAAVEEDEDAVGRLFGRCPGGGLGGAGDRVGEGAA